MRKRQKLKLKGILQNNWSVFFKNVEVMKGKESLGNCHILEIK